MKEFYNNTFNTKGKGETMKTYETYLHIRHNSTGEEWTQEIEDDWTMDLKSRVKHWLKGEFCGELKLDGDIDIMLDGEYTGTIYTDNRKPDSGICWTCGGFYVKSL